MPNPFTRFISQNLKSRRPKQFIALWDELEYLLIASHRGLGNSPGDAARWRTVITRLTNLYPGFKNSLQPYWPDTLIGGVPAAGDPFEFLLTIRELPSPGENWRAMQTLPAAREALNRMLLAMPENRVE